MQQITTGRFDFFSRVENSRVHPHLRPARQFSLQLPIETTLAEALAAAYAAHMPRGTNRAGCFQIQNDRGIWNHINGNRMDPSTPRKAAKCVFKTWEELEAEELAELAAESAAA